MTERSASRPLACATPVDIAVLMDYWLGLVPQPEEERIELHLFSCDSCGDALRQMIALSAALGELARSGQLRVVVGEHFHQRAAAAGQHVRTYAPQPGTPILCTVSADDDYLVARLGVDLAGAERVDISLTLEGAEIHRMLDIPVNATSGTVVYQESIGFAKEAPTCSMRLRFLAVDESGAERVIGEYSFHHTRTIPGPPGW